MYKSRTWRFLGNYTMQWQCFDKQLSVINKQRDNTYLIWYNFSYSTSGNRLFTTWTLSSRSRHFYSSLVWYEKSRSRNWSAQFSFGKHKRFLRKLSHPIKNYKIEEMSIVLKQSIIVTDRLYFLNLIKYKSYGRYFLPVFCKCVS